MVAIPIDERVGGIAISLDGGVFVDAVGVLDALGFEHSDRASFDGHSIGSLDIVDLQCDVRDAVTMLNQSLGVWVAGA